MSIRLGDSEVLALIACGATIWLLLSRGKLASESNWPLLYYISMVIYQKAGGGFIDSSFLYAGVVCAMMIRFEFMSQTFSKVFRLIEAVCLIYVSWRCVDYVFFR